MKKQANHTEEQVDVQAQQPEDTLKNEIELWKEKYARVLADYQNLERRSREKEEQIRKFSAEMTITKLLPAIDGLETAARHIQDQGFALSVQQFYTILETIGVKRIVTREQPFDPYTMECIEVVDGPEDQVVEEFSPGYTLYDKVIRVAKVKVGKKI